MTTPSIIKPDSPLLTKIKKYKKRAAEIKTYLDQRPDEWGRFQSEFNQEINGIFRDVMLFEKECLANGREDKLYKLRQFFINRLQKEFVKGQCSVWSFEKPYGYAGDYKIIDDIYLNSPKTIGFDRLFDNYFQMSAISVAVRNRKEDFKRIIIDFIMQGRERTIRIMDLASGPCRDIHELFQNNTREMNRVTFDCFDGDHRAIGYAKQHLQGHLSKVNFTQLNIIKIALCKNVQKEYPERYDIIYSTGLFDYLDTKVSIRLIKNLKQLLMPGGILAISDVRDKYSNPSIYFMEWAGEWNLIYRSDDEFREIFVGAGFKQTDLHPMYEQQGIMQYVVAQEN